MELDTIQGVLILVLMDNENTKQDGIDFVQYEAS